jgi:hypothetical protein
MNDILNFGKYYGKSLQWVALHDPDYLFWLVEENAIRDPLLRSKAGELALKARNIKLPRSDAENWYVVYIPHKGDLACVEIIPKARLDPYRSQYWADHIDLSMARQWKRYDKSGGQVLIKAVKRLYFKDGNVRLTDQRCRDFFANADHFVLDTTADG